MYTSSHTCINTYMHTHTLILTHTHSHTYSLTLTWSHSHTYTHIVSHRHIYLHTYTLTHTHTHTLIPVLSAAEAGHGTERWFSPRHSPALPVRGQGAPARRKEPPLSAPGPSSPSHLACVQSARVHGLSPHAQPRTEGQGVSAEPVELDLDPQGARLSWPRSQGPGAASQLLLGLAGVQPTVLSPRAPPVPGWQPLRHSDLCSLHCPCWGTAAERASTSVQSLD